MILKEAAPELDLAPEERSEIVEEASGDRGHWLAIAILVGLPAIVFTMADLLGGHLLLSGDNLLQNYPLRVFAGTALRNGSLPFWDPLVWSGTPLLAGLNSGAFYPMSLLFAAASSHVAWVIGEIFVFSSVGVGTFLLFRSGGISAFASFLGAFSFTFAGAVASQTSVHIDMGDGLASLPWALLAVRRIGQDGRWRWALVLGAAFGLSVLAGSPEAVLDIAAVCLAFALLSWWTRRGTFWIFATRIAVGAGLAIGLTSFLWIPSLHFIAHSQRPAAGELFASEFSYPAYTGILAVIPYLEGGYSLFSQPSYFGQSNLGEIAIYVGILPVIATLTVLTRPWRNKVPKSELVCWYGVLLVGFVLAVGADSPLEHLLYHLPFYGKQRDSGRNIVDIDLAACALFAWWIDIGRQGANALDRSRLRRHDKVAALTPLAVVAVAGFMFVVSRGELWHLLSAVPPPALGAAGSGAAILLALGLAAGAAVVVLVRPRAGRAWWARVLTAFVVADIGLFLLGSGYAFAQQPQDTSNPGAVLALVKANLSPAGRYGVFDPDLFDPAQFVSAGEPDLGLLDGLPSISGYGSIVDARYASQTGTQIRGFMDISNLQGGLYKSLGLQVLVTVPESFLIPVAEPPVAGGPIKALSEQPGTDPALPGGNSPPPLPPLLRLGITPARPEIGDSSSGWWFGTTLALSRGFVELGEPAAGQVVRMGVLSSTGVRWGTPVHLSEGAESLQVPLGDQAGDGIELEVLSGAPLRSVRVTVETQGGRYYLTGSTLANAVQPDEWAEVGTAGDFAVFRALYTPKAAWVQGSGTESTSPSPASAVAGSDAKVVATSTNSDAVETTTTHPGLLVWSTAWDPGWTAELVKPGGDKSLAVKRVGLLQGVEVPAGTSLVRFSYKPPGFSLGLMLSLFTFVLLVVVCALVLATRRRRVHDGPRDALNM